MQRTTRRAVTALLLVGLLAGGAALALAPVRAAAPLAPLGSASPGACGGVRVIAAYTGRLSNDGAFGANFSVVNRSIELTYQYQQNTTTPAGRSVVCVAANATARTGSNGAFDLSAPVPAENCSSPHLCETFAGPFGPIAFAVVGGNPPGNLLRVRYAGAQVNLTWTSALGSIAVAPGGPLVLSTGDPANLSVTASAGDGGPSPADLAIYWDLTGAVWDLRGPTNATNATAVAPFAAGPGLLTVFVNGSYNGTTYPKLEGSVQLSAVATSVATANESRVALDAGQTIGVSLTGTGAEGYNYTASVDPGLGVPNATLPCRGLTPSSPVVTLSCHGTIAYPAAGTAQPTVRLTNGYSSAGWDLPTVVVAPPPTLELGPDPAAGYANASIPFQLNVGAGTGTAPFGRACLYPGDGAGAVCSDDGTAGWSLGYAYPEAGSYDAVATLLDAAGTNTSATVRVVVAERPVLGPLVGCPAGSGPVYATDRLTLSAALSGGLWPATYFWNATAPDATVADGLRAADGAIALALTPSLLGPESVTLTVVDALGTRVATTCSFDVVAGPAVALDLLGSTDRLPLDAGGSGVLTYRAADAAGRTVSGFDPPVNLSVAGPADGTLTIEDPAGPVSVAAGGTVELPPSAWTAGVLNLTVATTTAGTWNVTVGANGTAPRTVVLAVAVDAASPRLVDPVRGPATGRSGALRFAVVDPYGNPIVTGYVVVRAAFGVATVDTDAPIRDVAGQGIVWVNYSALDDGAGVVLVLSPTGTTLYGPLTVPAAPTAPDPGPWMLAISGLLVIATAATIAVLRFRRRSVGSGPGEVADAELERHAAGRAHLLKRLSEGAGGSLSELARGWAGPPPVPDRTELSEWLSALVDEGAVLVRSDEEGRSIFEVAPELPGPPALYLDDAALERALSQRSDADPDGAESPS